MLSVSKFINGLISLLDQFGLWMCLVDDFKAFYKRVYPVLDDLFMDV
jgi:hypothetical protein